MRQIILFALTLILMACEKKTEVVRFETATAPAAPTETVTAPPITTESGGGGMDGSGGDTQVSTPKDVEDWVRRIWFELPYSIARFEFLISQMEEVGILEEARHMNKIFPIFRWGYQGHSLGSALSKLRLNLQDKPCLENGEEKDGSFSADGVICLSKDRLTRIPNQDLPGEIHGLIFHEIAHSVSADETTAADFQKAMVRYSNFGIANWKPTSPPAENQVVESLRDELDEFFVHATFDKLRIQSPTGIDFCRWNDRIQDQIQILTFMGGLHSEMPTWTVSPKAFFSLEAMVGHSPTGQACFGKPMDLEAHYHLSANFNREFWIGYGMLHNNRLFPDEHPQFMGSRSELIYKAMAPFFGKDLKDVPNTEFDKISCELVTRLPTGKVITQKFEKDAFSSSDHVRLNLTAKPPEGVDDGTANFRPFQLALKKRWLFTSVDSIPLEIAPFVAIDFDDLFLTVDEIENSKMPGRSQLSAILQKDSISKISWSFRKARQGDLKPYRTQHKITCVLAP